MLAALAGLPALAVLIVSPFSAPGPAGVFQADLAGLVVAVGVAGFLARRRGTRLLALLAAVALLGAAHGIVAGRFAGVPAQLALALALCTASSGLAALGRALGAPALTAGAVAGAVLWIAMTGIVWADPLAEALPRERRFAFRQAVVHLDAATACAFDAAGFDRFHDARIYRRIPLAASLVRAPAAGTTSLAWLALGLAAWGAAAGLRSGLRSRS